MLFARVLTVTAPKEHMEAGVEMMKGQIPRLKGLRGFAGVTMMVNKEKGRAVAISLWRNQKAAREALAGGKATREEATAKMGAKFNIRSYRVFAGARGRARRKVAAKA